MAAAPIRALEFYSGIGGMHYALQAVAPTAEVVAAFDINDVANDVYAHNFQQRPWQGNIEKVPASIIDGHQADIWLMAPPCQPYTRRGLQKDSGDGRAASFLRLVDLLPRLEYPPEFLLLENVIGFESSRMRGHLAATLTSCGYQLQEFLLSPLQLGIPYSRPRYFGIARRMTDGGSAAFQLPCRSDGLPFRQPPSQLLANNLLEAACNGHAAEHSLQTAALHAFLVTEPGDEGRCPLGGLPQEAAAAEEGPLEEGPPEELSAEEPQAEVSDGPCSASAAGENKGVGTSSGNGSERSDAQNGGLGISSGTGSSEQAVAESRDMGTSSGNSSGRQAVADNQVMGISSSNGCSGPAVAECRDMVTSSGNGSGSSSSAWGRFMVPAERWGYALDIVAPQSQRCNCFTRTYTRYSKGSGSVLATSNLTSLRNVTALPGLHRGDMDILPANSLRHKTPSRLGLDCLAAKPHKPDRIPSQPGSSAGTTSCASEESSEGNAATSDGDRVALPDMRTAATAEACRDTLEAEATFEAFPGGVSKCIGSERENADGRCVPGGMVTMERRGPGEGICSESNQAAGRVARHANDPADGSTCCAPLAVGDGRELTEASQAASMHLTDWLKTLNLRYFTPREVANLHSFPPQFGFPEHVTLRQRYSQLGNSLSVAVVADLLAYMLPKNLQF